MAQKKGIFGQHFLPFFAGIACGIFISILLFLLFASPAIFEKLWTEKNNLDEIDSSFSPHHDSDQDFVMKQAIQNVDIIERDHKMYDKELNNKEINSNQSIPIEYEKEPEAVENPAWELNLTPVHIPGFLSQELKLKKKVFVAVLNPSVSASSVTEHIAKTWAKGWSSEGHGDITIYSTLGNGLKNKDVNTFYLALSSENVDHISAGMLYQTLNDLCSQHLDAFHHFFVVSSNTYVSLPRLLNFTNRLDDSKILWIGGKANTNDYEKSYLNDPSFYCSLNAGFVLSRHALQNLCPKLSHCQQEYNRNNGQPAGLQFSRCLLRYLNISCTYPENEDLFYQSRTHALLDPYDKSQPYKDSISVSPVRDETALYKLHHYFLSQQINETIKANSYYHNIIQNMDRVLVQEGGMADDRLILGRNGNKNKYQHGDVITWDKIELDDGIEKSMFLVNDANPSKDLTLADKTAINKVKHMALHHVIEKYGNLGDYSTSNIFRRVVPGVGYQYMVDITDKNKEMATVCLNQPYDRMITVSTSVAPDAKVNFVLPLQDKSPYFKDFMQMFEQACMSIERAQNVALLVVLYTQTDNNSQSFDEIKSETLTTLNLYKQKYPDLSLRWINGGEKPYSHIEGMSMAVRALPAETLLCSTNLFTLMSPEFLHHARLNTLAGEQLFFPAAFQRLKSTSPDEDISKTNGFWRSFDYSYFCGYKQDIIRACGGENFISGVDLFEKALASGLDTFRAPEHALSQSWHESDCQNSLLSKSERAFCEEANKFSQLAVSALL